MNNMYTVKAVESKETHEFILEMHYAQRLPSISYAFGLFEELELVAILTIGKPASAPLCVGVMGKEFKSHVYELNRLCAKKKLADNALSFFVGNVLKRLKKENLVLISYADTGAGHNGYIYQATNWIYTGKSAERTDKYMPGNKHPRHYTDEYTHLRKVRTSKHRYIYICADKKTKAIFLNNLKYKEEPYPKGENINYTLGEKILTKVLNKNTNEYFFE